MNPRRIITFKPSQTVCKRGQEDFLLFHFSSSNTFVQMGRAHTSARSLHPHSSLNPPIRHKILELNMTNLELEKVNYNSYNTTTIRGRWRASCCMSDKSKDHLQQLRSTNKFGILAGYVSAVLNMQQIQQVRWESHFVQADHIMPLFHWSDSDLPKPCWLANPYGIVQEMEWNIK